MGSRYFITGVELGMIRALIEMKEYDGIITILDKIEYEQYVAEKEEFDKNNNIKHKKEEIKMGKDKIVEVNNTKEDKKDKKKKKKKNTSKNTKK